MKSCPVCHAAYPDEAAFCGSDGTPLVARPEVPATAPCAKCGTQMRRGFLYRTNSQRLSGDMRYLTWLEGDSPDENIQDVHRRGATQFRLTSYRCPACGYVELYAVEPQQWTW
ncbi:MAG: PF20097 family protein [Acidobacteria bacterium]|nr:PF20097 family protein [Acidobacteriota bacterium]